MRISDWSSDVCSSDLAKVDFVLRRVLERIIRKVDIAPGRFPGQHCSVGIRSDPRSVFGVVKRIIEAQRQVADGHQHEFRLQSAQLRLRSEEHTSELQSLMRISYAVFCSKINNLQIQHPQ